jgi:single-stranded-DNA-specific exonuclease
MRIEPRQLPATLPFLGDLPPLLTRLYAARGVQSEAELDKSLARLIPFQQLKGIDAAVDLLVTALEQRQRILIVGDFDADARRPAPLACSACVCSVQRMLIIWCRTVSNMAMA